MRVIQIILILVFSSCSLNSLQRSPSSNLSRVSSLLELREAIECSLPYSEIIIEDGTKIDMTNERPLIIDKPLTIRSGNKLSRKNRAHFFSRSPILSLFIVKASDVLMTGLKIEGPEKDTREQDILPLVSTYGSRATYRFPLSRGIDVRGHNFRLEHSELWGWSHAAVMINGASNAKIQFNFIHHNQRYALGYGVVLNKNASALISYNQFDFNRHSIAGTGHAGQRYEASYNIFGKNHTHSPLDMHGGKDRGDGTNIAGDKVHIHHNRIHSTNVPIFFHRGIPREVVLIEDNQLSHKKESGAIRYGNGVTKKDLAPSKFIMRNNIYNSNKMK